MLHHLARLIERLPCKFNHHRSHMKKFRVLLVRVVGPKNVGKMGFLGISYFTPLKRFVYCSMAPIELKLTGQLPVWM